MNPASETEIPDLSQAKATPSSNGKLLIRALRGEVCDRPPIWLMRQAGRYLPEYRETRKRAGSFLELCRTPDLAVEVTLQPLRRFELDAAIMFSDILVVPMALGQKLWFEEGQGPKLAALETRDDIERLAPERLGTELAPVFETIGRLSREIPARTALIGFAGAPWTVASYMLEGGGSRDFAVAKSWMFQRPADFERLIDLLVEATTDYLLKQVEAGAEALQLFDSWAGALPATAQRRWCLEPARRIVSAIKAGYPDVPVILFPRGSGALYLEFASSAGAEGLSLDTAVPVDWARENLQGSVTPQGNLDPLAVVAGGDSMRREAESILAGLASGPFVFNLGHGLVPQTPPEHVGALVSQVKAWRG